jgi:hypothetical protein
VKEAVMRDARSVTVTRDEMPRAVALEQFIGRVVARGWLGGATDRAVLHIGVSGRSRLAVDTAQALATVLRERSPSLHLEVLDPAERGGEPNGCRRLTLDRDDDDIVEVQGPRGVSVHVPLWWFGSFFLITVAAVHPDRRWRLGGVLQAQAEILAPLNPGVPRGVLLAEAHRLGAPDLAVACGTHAARGDWWVASSNDVLVEAMVARAAGIDPRKLPSLRTIARHEVLESWDSAADLPRLPGLAQEAWTAAVLAARERGVAAGRRSLEDVGRVSRNLRKVPQALRRRLTARTSGRRSG